MSRGALAGASARLAKTRAILVVPSAVFLVWAASHPAWSQAAAGPAKTSRPAAAASFQSHSAEMAPAKSASTITTAQAPWPPEFQNALLAEFAAAPATARTQRRALRGDPRAEFQLAMERYRRATAADFAAAAHWARQAAQQGYAAAEYLLAGLYAGGWGVPRDLARAYAWAGRAARDAAKPSYLLSYAGHVRLAHRWPPPTRQLDITGSVTGLELPASPPQARAARRLAGALARRLPPAQPARAPRARNTPPAE